jgi:hypothetical protein
MGVQFLAVARDSPQCPDWLRSTQPSIQRALRAVSLGGKQLGHEADYSPPSSAKVKNGGAIPPISMYLHGVVLN